MPAVGPAWSHSEPQIPLGMFSLPVPTAIAGPLPRQERQAGLWLGRHRDPSAIDAPRKSLALMRADQQHPSPGALPGALEQGKTSLLESPRLLTRWGISFLEPGKAAQIHQVFRLRVCGWAKGKMCLTPELYPLVVERASALSPWDPCVGWDKPCLLTRAGQGQ